MSSLSVFPRLVIVPLCLLFGLAGCPKPAAAPPSQAKAPAPVRTALVTEQAIPLRVTAPGTVAPMAAVQLKAQVTGPVTQVLVEEGAMVAQGQPLFEIDSRPYTIGVAQAEANLAKARAQSLEAEAMLNHSRAQAENARAELARDKPLREKGMISPQEFERSQANAKMLDAAVEAQGAGVQSAREAIGVAEAALQQARLQLEYCSIRAPIAGKVGQIMVKQGNLARANDSVSLATINQIAPIHVEVPISDRFFALIQAELARGPVKVSATIAETGETLEGAVAFVDNALDETGSLKVWARFENASLGLWPGQIVRTAIDIPARQAGPAAPNSAVQVGQQGTYAWVVDAGLKAEMRLVKAGNTLDGMTAVLEGLQPGERVVVDGHLRVSPGGEVRLLDESKAAESPAQ